MRPDGKISLQLVEEVHTAGLQPEVRDILTATSLGTLVIFLASLIFEIGIITPVFLALFWVGTSILTVTSRLLLRSFLKQIRIHGRNFR